MWPNDTLRLKLLLPPPVTLQVADLDNFARGPTPLRRRSFSGNPVIHMGMLGIPLDGKYHVRPFYSRSTILSDGSLI